MSLPKIEGKITYGTILSTLVVIGSLLFASFSFYTSSLNTSLAIPLIKEEIKTVIEDHNRDLGIITKNLDSSETYTKEEYVSKELFYSLSKNVDDIRKDQKETNRLLIKILNKK